MPHVPTAVLPLSRKIRDQRWRLAPWRLRAERAAIPRLGKKRPRTSGRVLSYHSTGTPAWGVNDVSPANFVSQIELARTAGYRFCDARDIASGSAGPRDLAVTFDDGLRSILAVAPYLTEARIPYTIFVVSGWPANDPDTFLNWADLERLGGQGAQIGSHSASHPNFRELTRDQQEFELGESRRTIGDRLGVVPDLFAIPFGRARDWSAECTQMAKRAGYAAVFGQAENRTPKGTAGRSFITKFDGQRQFQAVLDGRFDDWEEWF